MQRGNPSRGHHGEASPSARRRQPSTRQRFGCCRVCLGRVEPADQLTCADCGVCVHRGCATDPPGRRAAARAGWRCACCSLACGEGGDALGGESAANVAPAMETLEGAAPTRAMAALDEAERPMAVTNSNSSGSGAASVDNNDNNKRCLPPSGEAEEAEENAAGPAKRPRPSCASASTADAACSDAPADAQPSLPQCPICQQPMGAATATARPEICGHTFCYVCLLRWRMQGSEECPLDRLPYSAMLVTPVPGQPPVKLPAPPPVVTRQQQLQAADEAANNEALDGAPCIVCGLADRPEPQFEDMVECDHCEACYHLECLGPDRRLQLETTVVEGQTWYCDDCQAHVVVADGGNEADVEEEENNNFDKEGDEDVAEVADGDDEEDDENDDDEEDEDADDAYVLFRLGQ